MAARVPRFVLQLLFSEKSQNSATTEDREKISADLDSEQFENFFDIGLTKFETYQILFNKISHRFPMTTKLFTG